MRTLVLFVLAVIYLQNNAIAQSGGLQDCSLDRTLQVQTMLDSVAAAFFKASQIQGYRILLYTGNNRTLANLAKENAYHLFPKGDVYLTYQSPTFKVRYGNFYSRLDAWQTLLKCRQLFPNALITNEIVLVKP